MDGPLGYANWLAFLSGKEWNFGFEVPIYTDVDFLPLATQVWGPYELHNTLAGRTPITPIRPMFVLRAFDHLPGVRDMPPHRGKTDVSRFHGRGIDEEIISLGSLCTGVPLRCGELTRWFSEKDDLRGRPLGANIEGAVLRPFRGIRPLLPNARVLDPEQLPRMKTYPSLQPEQAMALARASILYGDAVWLADGEPQLSWLMLVSALEVAAQLVYSNILEDPVQELKELKRDLYDILEAKGDHALLDAVARTLRGIIGSTRKFVRFVIDFLPPPPSSRPPAKYQVDWSVKAMEVSLRTIYAHRSKALHEGIPFPDAMCQPPIKREDDWAAPTERPTGPFATKGGAWVAKDAPMLLHTFEHITRRSLLNWWDSMVV